MNLKEKGYLVKRINQVANEKRQAIYQEGYSAKSAFELAKKKIKPIVISKAQLEKLVAKNYNDKYHYSNVSASALVTNDKKIEALVNKINYERDERQKARLDALDTEAKVIADVIMLGESDEALELLQEFLCKKF